MKKINTLIVLMTTILAFTVQAQADATKEVSTVNDIVGIYSLNANWSTAVTPENMDASFLVMDNSKGLYLIDDNGNIFYEDTDGLFYKNGIAPDHYLYDENGVQVNSLNYIRDKYYEKFKSLSSDERLVFDNNEDINLFFQFYQLYSAVAQGKSCIVYHAPDGTLQITKNEFTSMPHFKSDEYDEKVKSLSSQLNEYQTTNDKIVNAAKLVSETFKYDDSYLLKDINEAIKNGKGVCYHFAKLLHDVLEKSGIYSEYMSGHYQSNTSYHVWNKVWNEEENKYVYIDPTIMNGDMMSAMFNYEIPASYLQNYEQSKITESE